MVEWLSDWLCVLASMFCVRIHPLTTRGGVRLEVGWAVLADVLVVFVFGVVFVFRVISRFLASIHVCARVCYFIAIVVTRC